MPITTKQITDNNGVKIFKHHDIKLEIFIKNWVIPEKIKFPKWQREDCWTDEYRIELIESIMIKNDIPKFYLSQIDNNNSNLLDGGHRTRSILNYMKNEFSIKIDELFVYYDKIPAKKSERKNRILNESENDIFNNYKLSLCIYENLTELESRKIFNTLQNSQPMSMADIVNSHVSPLVDFLRIICDYKISEDLTLSEYVNSVKDIYFPNKKNNKLLYHLASIWTIVVPSEINEKSKDDTNDIKALSYSLQGENKKTSTCWHYIKNYNSELIDKNKDDFINIILWYIKIINNLENYEMIDKLKRGECLSLIHSYIYINNFSVNKYFNMIKDIRQYEFIKKESEKLIDHNYEQYCANKEKYETLDGNYNNNLSIWSKGCTNINKDHMNRRYNTIKEYCTDNNSLLSDCETIGEITS